MYKTKMYKTLKMWTHVMENRMPSKKYNGLLIREFRRERQSIRSFAGRWTNPADIAWCNCKIHNFIFWGKTEKIWSTKPTKNIQKYIKGLFTTGNNGSCEKNTWSWKILEQNVKNHSQITNIYENQPGIVEIYILILSVSSFSGQIND